jgi:hypothetical protein
VHALPWRSGLGHDAGQLVQRGLRPAQLLQQRRQDARQLAHGAAHNRRAQRQKQVLPLAERAAHAPALRTQSGQHAHATCDSHGASHAR